MALPLISKSDIINTLSNTIPKVSPRIEISDEFPSEENIIRYGVFVDDVFTTDKSPVKLGVQYGGSVYSVTDEFMILFVGIQNDVNTNSVTQAIQDLSSNIVLLNGYHEVDFTQDVVIGNRSEKRTYTFTLKRIEFLT
jgi:hypothetical protein